MWIRNSAVVTLLCVLTCTYCSGGDEHWRRMHEQWWAVCEEYFGHWRSTWVDCAENGMLPSCWNEIMNMTTETLYLWRDGTREDRYNLWIELKKKWDNYSDEVKQQRKDCWKQCREKVNATMVDNGYLPNDDCKQKIDQWRSRSQSWGSGNNVDSENSEEPANEE